MAKSTAAARTATPSVKKTSKVQQPVPGNEPQGDLAQLLVIGINQLYWIENHLVMALPKMHDSAGDAALKKALGDHLKVTRRQVTRLEEVFRMLGLPPLAKKSDGLEGLVIEGEGIINSTVAGSASRDAGLIMACQKVETYEATAYKGLALLAGKLGQSEIAGLLEQTMAEEQEADTLLANLASKK